MDNQDFISLWTIAFSSSTIASSPLSEEQGSATSDLATSLWITLTLTRLRILRFRLSFHKWCWTLGHSWTQFVGGSIFRHDDVVELKIGSRAHNLQAQMGSLAIAKLGLIWVTICLMKLDEEYFLFVMISLCVISPRLSLWRPVGINRLVLLLLTKLISSV